MTISPPLISQPPEHWAADAGEHGVVQLDIPPDAHRLRAFEVYCRLVVRGGLTPATHGLRVVVNGSLAWSRTVPTPVSATDSLDFRLRRHVPAGEALRITATSHLKHAMRLSLSVTADEE